MKRHLPVFAAAGLLLLSGCQLFGGAGTSGPQSKLKEVVKPYGTDEKTTLTLFGGASMTEKSFLASYGPSYLVKFPNIEVAFPQLAPSSPAGSNTALKDPFQAYISLIEEMKPDLLLLPPQFMEELGKRGVIDDLGPYIKQDKFDLQTLSPAVVDYLRKRSGGKLYGLTPFFYSSALVYNKDLFEKYHVNEPKEGMTWPDVLELAAKFPSAKGGADGVAGLYIPDDFPRLLEQMETAEGVVDFDSAANKVKVADDAHRKVWNAAADALRTGVIRLRPPGDQMIAFRTPTLSTFVDPFAAGQAAMAVEPSGGIGVLPMLKDSNLQPFDWQWTTPPQGPGGSPYYQVGSVFAINAKSGNKRAAWQLLKYWSSEEYAAYLAKLGGPGGGMSVRLFSQIADNKALDGRSLEPFYKPVPSSYDYPSPGPGADPIVTGAYYPIFTEQAKAVSDGIMTVDEALSALQKKAQTALDGLSTGK